MAKDQQAGLLNFYHEPKAKHLFSEPRQTLGRRLRREAVRFGRQLRFIGRSIDYYLQQRTHDKNFSSHVSILEGRQSLRGRVAVLVLYQPDGLCQSTLESCALMAEKGYSVFAISNCPLTHHDQTALAGVCWRYGSRPNYGYDAGAYRDAVRYLSDFAGSLDEVLLINDSIWFPLGASGKVLEDISALPAGFGGLVLKTKRTAEKAHKRKWDDFVEAYFYRCSGDLIGKNGSFWSVWRRLLLTPGRADLKEGRVSYAIARRGHRLHTLGSRRAFLDGISGRPCAFIHKTLRYGAYTDFALAQHGSKLIAGWDGSEDLVWKAEAVAHIHETVHQVAFNHAFVFGSEMLFGLSFLKKSTYGKANVTVRAYLAAVDAGDLPPPSPAQLEEMRIKVAAC